MSPILLIRRRASALVAAAALVGNAGCADRSMFAPRCPPVAILSDQGIMTQFAPRGHDLSDLVLDARLAGIGGRCTAISESVLAARATLSFALTRGPMASGRAASITYFLAVARAGAILDKQVYRMAVEFPANLDTVHVQTPPIRLRLAFSPDVPTTDYTIYAGFALTPAQLAENRRATSALLPR